MFPEDPTTWSCTVTHDNHLYPLVPSFSCGWIPALLLYTDWEYIGTLQAGEPVNCRSSMIWGACTNIQPPTSSPGTEQNLPPPKSSHLSNLMHAQSTYDKHLHIHMCSTVYLCHIYLQTRSSLRTFTFRFSGQTNKCINTFAEYSLLPFQKAEQWGVCARIFGGITLRCGCIHGWNGLRERSWWSAASATRGQEKKGGGIMHAGRSGTS